MREVATEVHSEVSQILKHNDVMLVCQFANALQLFLGEANPRRIVRIRIHDAVDIALRHYLIELLDKSLTTIAVDIETYVLQADYITLGCLHREARLNEQHGVLLSVGHSVTDGKECGECALHTTSCRDATERVDIKPDESLAELRCSLLDARNTAVRRILSSASVSQCLLLSLQGNIRRLETRNAHLKMNNLLSSLLLKEL